MSEFPSPMTVGELIAKLQTYPPTFPVMINGYEWGYDYPKAIGHTLVRDDWGEDASYGGRFEVSRASDAFGVILITRNGIDAKSRG